MELYFKLNMRPLSNFNPHPAVLKRLGEKGRRSRIRSLATQQEWCVCRNMF